MWRLTIENVAGIRSGEATIEPGVNAVEASNWRGKSSLIAAVETALGTATPLTAGADSGRVSLEADGETRVTELVREGGAVRRDGAVYLADEQDRVCAALFAALGETNEIRRAVREGADLEALLTRPLDLEDVDERIAELRAEREAVDRELEAAEDAASKLPAAQERVRSLETSLEELREELADLVEAAGDDRDVDDDRERLSEQRAARDRAAGTVERLEEQIDDLEAELADRRAELAALSVPEESTVESDLADARDRLATVEDEIELLQAVYNANRRIVEEGRADLLTSVDRSLAGDEVECWVCGESTGRDAIETRLDAIGERVADRRRRAADLEESVEDLESERRSIEEARRRERDLADEVDRLETRLTDLRGDLETARERYESLEAEVESLATSVRDADERLTDVESEIKYQEAELSDAREELSSIETRAERCETLSAEREELGDEIESLRTRKERVERETREAFDDAMVEVLSTFEPGFESARLTGDFELVVAREGREVGPDALSEGEVELLGIVAALAGYEAFDVADRVPVILLDGLGGLAGENLHRLLDYLDGRAEYLVTTAYPEQGDYDWHVISPAPWDVVSDEPTG